MSANAGVIQTGVEALDAVLQVLLSTSILVGGIVGCFLDNLIPGKLCICVRFHSPSLKVNVSIISY